MHRLQAVGWLVICFDNRASSHQILLIRSQSSSFDSCSGDCKVTSHTMQAQDEFATCNESGLCIVEDHGPHCAHRLPRSVSEEETAVQDKLTVLATMGSPVVQHIVAS